VDLNDELLCAYLDDELDVARRKQVAAALAADAGAQLRLQRMRDADRTLQAALPLQGGDHFEAAMKARILGVAPAWSWRRHVLPWAAAAGIAGLSAGYLLPRAITTQSGEELMQLAPAVQAMLETRPSGGAADGLAVVLTFRAGDSRFCRVFRGGSGAAAGEGLACRSGSGTWQLTGWDAGTDSGEAYRPAGASPVVDAAMTALGGEPALDALDEARLISQGWRTP
jgi:hypothetical protein